MKSRGEGRGGEGRDSHLTRAMGCRQAAAPPVLVDSAAGQHGHCGTMAPAGAATLRW